MPIPLRILVVSQYYHPDITAAAFRVKETVELLRRKGHHVEVLTARPHRATAEGKAPPAIDETGVVRTPIVRYRGGGRWNYILHYLSFLLFAVVAGIFRLRGRFDLVWATSPPLFVGVAGFILALVRRAELVLDIRDIWPDSAAATGQLSQKTRLFRWAKGLEVWLYRRARLITCVASPMAGYLRGKAPETSVEIIYNGVPSELLDSCASHPAPPAPPPLTITYVGNMGYLQDLALLLQAADRLRNAGRTDMRFELIGEGVEKARLLAQKKALGLTNVEILGPLSKPEAIARTCNASALFLQLREDPTLEMTIPSKVFDYLAARRPILFGLSGEGRTILSRCPANLPFSPNDLPTLLDALERLRNDYARLTHEAAENRKLAEEFTREAMVDRLDRAFRKVVSGSPAIPSEDRLR